MPEQSQKKQVETRFKISPRSRFNLLNIILILGAMNNIFHNISHILHSEQFERMHHCCGLCKHIVNKFMNLDLVMKMRNTFVKQYINKPSMHSIPV